jgi:hypothetical protein
MGNANGMKNKTSEVEIYFYFYFYFISFLGCCLGDRRPIYSLKETQAEEEDRPREGTTTLPSSPYGRMGNQIQSPSREAIAIHPRVGDAIFVPLRNGATGDGLPTQGNHITLRLATQNGDPSRLPFWPARERKTNRAPHNT